MNYQVLLDLSFQFSKPRIFSKMAILKKKSLLKKKKKSKHKVKPYPKGNAADVCENKKLQVQQ